MTRFSFEGNWHGRLVYLLWQDGHWTADDPELMGWIQGFVDYAEGKPITTPAGTTRHDHMKDPHSAAAIVRMLLGPEAKFTGSVPPIPDPPPGAVR
jgi:hypothetical protein